jgi:hypothetical protein
VYATTTAVGLPSCSPITLLATDLTTSVRLVWYPLNVATAAGVDTSATKPGPRSGSMQDATSPGNFGMVKWVWYPRMVIEPVVRVNRCEYFSPEPTVPMADPTDEGKEPPPLAVNGDIKLAVPPEVVELEPATTVCAGDEWFDTA